MAGMSMAENHWRGKINEILTAAICGRRNGG
jgi:hypothetical protein